MFEQMLREMFLKMIQEDSDVRNAIMPILVEMAREAYDESVISTVKFAIENDESVQDVIRKQATTDIWEAVEDDVESAIDKAIDNLTICKV